MFRFQILLILKYKLSNYKKYCQKIKNIKYNKTSEACKSLSLEGMFCELSYSHSIVPHGFGVRS